jgi:hypothetical protein
MVKKKEIPNWKKADQNKIVCYDCGADNKKIDSPCAKCKSIRLGLEWIVIRHYGEDWRKLVEPYRRYG